LEMSSVSNPSVLDKASFIYSSVLSKVLTFKLGEVLSGYLEERIFDRILESNDDGI